MGNNFSVTHPLPIYRSTDLPDRGLLATTLVATSIVCSNPVGPPSNFKLNWKLDYVLQIRSDFAHEHLLHVQEHARHPAAALQVDPDSLVSQRRCLLATPQKKCIFWIGNQGPTSPYWKCSHLKVNGSLREYQSHVYRATLKWWMYVFEIWRHSAASRAACQ